MEKGVRHYPRTAGETSVRPSHIVETLKRIALMWKRIYYPGRRTLDPSNRSLEVGFEILPNGECVPPG